MTGKADNLNGFAADPYAVRRYFGDIAPAYSGTNAANVRARGAADRMWLKVEEDIQKMHGTKSEGADYD